MGRSRQPFTRDENYLDARKIIVIAFEGAKDKAEDRYLLGIQTLANDLCKPNLPRIHIKSIPNEDNKSAPNHIFENLKKFQQNYELDYDENESYLLIDWDAHEDNIKNYNIVDQCHQNQFHLALCRPCFELWLLLHYIDVEESSADFKIDLLENKRVSNSKRFVDQELFKKCGSSKKSNLNFDNYRDLIGFAISNAKKLEKSTDLLPEGLVARAYLIIENILGICTE